MCLWYFTWIHHIVFSQENKYETCDIHPFIYMSILLTHARAQGAGANPSWLMVRVGYTLDRMPVYHKEDIWRQTASLSLSLTHTYREWVTSQPNGHICGLWEADGEPIENSHRPRTSFGPVVTSANHCTTELPLNEKSGDYTGLSSRHHG